MNNFLARNPGVAAAAATALISVILLLDILLPDSLDVWLLYVIPVLMTISLRPRAIFYLVGLVCSLIVLAAPMLSDVAFASRELASRGIALAVFWTLALVMHRRRVDTEAAMESSATLHAAQRSAHVGTWLWDATSNRVTWSDELFRIVGLDPAHPPADLSQALAAAVHPDDRAVFEDAVRGGAGENRSAAVNPLPMDFRIRRPDGTERHLHAEMGEVVRDRNQRIVRASGIVQDITQRKQHEARLALQGAALAATANAVVITDAQGAIEWVNPAFTRVTGYTLAEVAGRNPRLLKSGQHPPEFYAEMWRTLRSGQSWSGEITNQRKDGALIIEQVTINPVQDATGRTTHYVAVKQDVTERKSLEKQLFQTQRLESIGLLASGIAHDLNNIIAPISLSVEMLRMRYPAEQKYLDLVEQCTKRGADIVRQVLTFSRGMDGTRVPLKLSRLVKEMTHLMHETLPRNIDVNYEIAVPHEPEVRADPTQVHQVLLNLAVNARDAMPQGGRLSLELTQRHLDEAAAARIAGAAPGDYVVVNVGDTGTGIPPEILPLIFDPFFTTKQRGQGTGLGLSTVHGIVRSHGGFIQIDTIVGKGTTFRVHFPAVTTQGEGSTPPVSAPADGLAGQGRLVLVVDDEALIREITETVLQKRGFTTVAAASGEEAIEVFRAHRDRVRIVILDRMMPGMNGEAVAAVIHQLAPDVPIFLSTGLVTEDSLLEKQAELRRSGIRTVLRKPYSEPELLQALREYADAPAETNPAG